LIIEWRRVGADAAPDVLDADDVPTMLNRFSVWAFMVCAFTFDADIALIAIFYSFNSSFLFKQFCLMHSKLN